jgi:hypothetical protein
MRILKLRMGIVEEGNFKKNKNENFKICPKNSFGWRNIAA